MSEAIVVAIISGIFTISAVLVSGAITNKKVVEEYHVSQAVTNERIDRLTEEVREHNNFARRVPVLEEQMKNAEYRIVKLEEK